MPLYPCCCYKFWNIWIFLEIFCMYEQLVNLHNLIDNMRMNTHLYRVTLLHIVGKYSHRVSDNVLGPGVMYKPFTTELPSVSEEIRKYTQCKFECHNRSGLTPSILFPYVPDEQISWMLLHVSAWSIVRISESGQSWNIVESYSARSIFKFGSV